MHSKPAQEPVSTFENHCLEGKIDYWQPPQGSGMTPDDGNVAGVQLTRPGSRGSRVLRMSRRPERARN